MKKIIMLLLCVVLLQGITVDVSAGELDPNETQILTKISDKSYGIKVEKQYINQLKNYFLRDGVSVTKMDSEDFVTNFSELIKFRTDANENTLTKLSSTYIKMEQAGSSIGLLLEYDSSINDYYFIDKDGYIVLDFQTIIKDTDSAKTNNNTSDGTDSWNVSIEIIFAIAIGFCILGLIANLKRWNKRNKRRTKNNYDDEEDDEDESELEVANKKTRRKRLQTFTYNNVKNILKYFYAPIIMGLIVIGICFAIYNSNIKILNSINTNFVNTQPIYIDSGITFTPAKEVGGKNIKASNVSWPKYGEQYGMIACKRLGIMSDVFFGDRGELLSNGAGIYSGSSIPGAGSTILVGGHDTTDFKGLKKVKKGDRFGFATTYGIYTYVVNNIKIYNSDEYDKAYDLSSKKEQLVLYTCYPFGKLNGTKTKRMFVYLDKVSGPNIEN